MREPRPDIFVSKKRNNEEFRLNLNDSYRLWSVKIVFLDFLSFFFFTSGWLTFRKFNVIALYSYVRYLFRDSIISLYYIVQLYSR